MYFTSNPKKLLAEAGADLKNLGVGIYHKELQEVETVSEHVLYCYWARKCQCEYKMWRSSLQSHSRQSRKERTTRPWDLPFAITKDFAPGMPWESDKDKSRGSGPRTSLPPCPGLVPLTGYNHTTMTKLRLGSTSNSYQIYFIPIESV
jgi:hypothetical protein